MRRIVLVALLALTAACTHAADTPTESLSSATPEASNSPEPSTPAPEPVATAKVPDISGLQLAKAEKILTKVGLETELKKEYSHDPVGSILQQNPTPGSKVTEGSVVLVVVAKAYPQIPSVLGLTLLQAQRALHKAGFDVRITKQGTSGTPGTVISQTPVAGTEALPGRKVTITTPNCTPGYTPCLVPASDYDCAEGTGDGPKYTGLVHVTGPDPYGLDADNDGLGCE